MYRRSLKPLKTQSFFLFGSRGTGKSTLLKALFDRDVLVYDLLDELELARLSRQPEETILQDLQAYEKENVWVILDEVQRLPALLNAVHRMIENQGMRFALTGSSARKLKRGGANLLAGRAFVYHLYPLTHVELAEDFELDAALHWGTLPKVTALATPEEKSEFLKAYVNTWLKEEIKEEQLVRSVDPFRRFLEVAAQSSGKILNYSKIARDSRSDDSSVKRYFEILEDTLVGIRLDPFHPSIRKREAEKPKFYLFDAGVQRAITRSLSIPIRPGTSAYGEAFEAFVIWEFIRLAEYRRCDFKFSFLRTKDDVEIDLIIERPGRKTVFIEIKSGSVVDPTDLRSQTKLINDVSARTGPVDSIVAYNGSQRYHFPPFTVLPWKEAISRVFESDDGVEG